MSYKILTFQKLIFFISLCTIILPQISLAEDQLVWNARIYSKNKNYIEVTVDCHNFSPLAEIKDISIPLNFLDRHKQIIGQKNFSFLDSKLPFLLGGKVYKRYFLNPYPSSISIEPSVTDESTSASEYNSVPVVPPNQDLRNWQNRY